MSKTRVFIADDNERMVNSLTDLINKQNDMEVVGTAFDGVKTVEKIELIKPDVCLIDIIMPGLDGLAKMKKLMDDLRGAPPKEIAGVEVFKIRDYSDGSIKVPELGVMGQTPIKGSNVLYFELADGTSFIVRPSGTEPKIKVYILAQGKDAADAAANVEKYGKWVDSLKK